MGKVWAVQNLRAGRNYLNYQRLTNSSQFSYSSLQLTAGLPLAGTGKEQFTKPQLEDSNTRGQEAAQEQGACNCLMEALKYFEKY